MNAIRAWGSTKRSMSNGRTSASGVSLAWPKISFRWPLAAIVVVRSAPIVPIYAPSRTASKSRASAAARRATRGIIFGSPFPHDARSQSNRLRGVAGRLCPLGYYVPRDCHRPRNAAAALHGRLPLYPRGRAAGGRAEGAGRDDAAARRVGAAGRARYPAARVRQRWPGLGGADNSERVRGAAGSDDPVLDGRHRLVDAGRGAAHASAAPRPP